MDDRFFNAFLPAGVRIAGRRLDRFTLWHQFLLSGIDSPLVSGKGKFGIPDLLAAVKICRSSYGPAPDMRPNLLDVFWSLRFRRNPRLFKKQAELLFRWVALQCSPPKYWKTSTGGSSQAQVLDNTPRSLALVVSLMTRGNLSRSDAWNTPVGESRWLDAMIARHEVGGIHFVDDADLDDSPISFDTMTDDEVLAQLKRDLPEQIAMNTFEKWKRERTVGNA